MSTHKYRDVVVTVNAKTLTSLRHNAHNQPRTDPTELPRWDRIHESQLAMLQSRCSDVDYCISAGYLNIFTFFFSNKYSPFPWIPACRPRPTVPPSASRPLRRSRRWPRKFPSRSPNYPPPSGAPLRTRLWCRPLFRRTAQPRFDRCVLSFAARVDGVRLAFYLGWWTEIRSWILRQPLEKNNIHNNNSAHQNIVSCTYSTKSM